MLRRILLSVSLLTLSATSISFSLISYQAQAQVPRPSGVITRPNVVQKCNASGLNPDLAQIQQSVHNQVNQYRASKGLAPLKLDACVNKQVQVYAQEMANAGKPLNHQGLEQRSQAVIQTIPHSSYAYYENEYYCFGCKSDPATSAVKWWLNSPAHLKNILSQTELTGIGVAVNNKGEYYFAQMFIHAR
ncbi:CAP domain-containing protein [Calothrix sp. PCC 7507]|uniref:CAP domain-containing protein n=1 Tax=Calothrix sp. PCC 7507 TaxID=99598 RepID=UPI00029EC4EC|nr:CAP domain-containing protein [Calothrix sp. PCC 7507]AFY30741.1 SCP-like extracellular [Calothrix sp. PCC 7507]